MGPRSRGSCHGLLEGTPGPKCGPQASSGITSPPSPLRPARLLEQSPAGSLSSEHQRPPPDQSSEAASFRKPSLTPSHGGGPRPGMLRAGSSSSSTFVGVMGSLCFLH